MNITQDNGKMTLAFPGFEIRFNTVIDLLESHQMVLPNGYRITIEKNPKISDKETKSGGARVKQMITKNGVISFNM